MVVLSNYNGMYTQILRQHVCCCCCWYTKMKSRGIMVGLFLSDGYLDRGQSYISIFKLKAIKKKKWSYSKNNFERTLVYLKSYVNK